MADYLKILPEICIATTLVFVVLGEVSYTGEKLRLVSAFAFLGFAGALLQVLISYRAGPSTAFYDAVSIDGLSLFFKFLFIVLGGFSVVLSRRSSEIPPERRAEFYVLLLGSCLGMCFAAGASELLLVFVALQAVNVLGYLLAGFDKRSILSTEAGVKYLVSSAVSGAALLYASGILFSEAHSLNIYEIHRFLVTTPLPKTQMLVVFLLLILSLGFQVALFPVSFWAPDVTEGAPTPISGFLSLGGRATGIVVALRLFLVMFTQSSAKAGQWAVLGELQWTGILTLLTGLTMLFGAFLAIRQNSAKRMVGCLAVVQTGFLMMGLLVLDKIGVGALLYNLVVELFSLIGIFYVLSFFHEEFGSDRLEDFKGVLSYAVPECVSLVLFLLCLVGVPPTPGFLGKFTLIGAVVQHNQLILAGVAIFSMVLSGVAVSRLVFSLVGDFQKTAPRKAFEAGLQDNTYRTVLLASILIPMLAVGIFAQFFLSWSGRSLGFIFW